MRTTLTEEHSEGDEGHRKRKEWVSTESRETLWSGESLQHPGTGEFLWITDAHGSKGCTRISADPTRHSGLWLRGQRGDAFGSVHGRPRNPRGVATRARCAQAGMPGCEEKCFLAFIGVHPCVSVVSTGFRNPLFLRWVSLRSVENQKNKVSSLCPSASVFLSNPSNS